MQRKANLGMNAVLSLSLALGRLVAARDGKELPDVLREMESTIDRDYLYGIKSAVAGVRRTGPLRSKMSSGRGRGRFSSRQIFSSWPTDQAALKS